MTFDISKLAAKETAELHLRGADDELLFDKDKPLTITMYGPGSKAYAKAQTANQNRMIDKLKKKGKTDQTAEEKAAEQAEFLAAVTVSFNNFTRGDLTGQELFKSVYSDVSLGYIAEQAGRFVNDWANFTKGSAKS